MEEGDNVTKHIHGFRSLLEQLSIVGAQAQDGEVIFSLRRSFPSIFWTFISFIGWQFNFTLQYLITNLLEGWMYVMVWTKNCHNLTIFNTYGTLIYHGGCLKNIL